MATAPSYVEQQSVTREKNLIENLLDFSFDQLVTPQMLKKLYGVHLLLGLIVGTGIVVKAFERSTSNGLLFLILSLVGMGFWMVYCRIIVELLAGIFRAVAVITNSDR